MERKNLQASGAVMVEYLVVLGLVALGFSACLVPMAGLLIARQREIEIVLSLPFP